MITIAFGTFLIGAVLGTRFRVQVLAPVAILGLMLVASAGLFRGFSFSSMAVAAVAYSVPLQIGYLFGLFARICMVATRGALHRSWRSDTART